MYLLKHKKTAKHKRLIANPAYNERCFAVLVFADFVPDSRKSAYSSSKSMSL
jgi:hypothetical protein